ncbi:MAG: hypothetical protein ACI4QR_04060 [Eubacteriales bacterium]
MKVLILSCYTGEGHNSAARAVKEELERRGIESEITDPVAFRSKEAQHFISSFYNNLIKKTPKAFGAIYKIGALYDSTGLTSPVYFANSTYAEKLNDYINEKSYDTVICTHLYGMEVMTAIRKKLGHNVPTYGIFTDYTCIPFISETELDGYFTPHESISEDFAKRGTPRERIYTTGIPVSAKFSERISMKEAREILEIPQDKKMFLFMTGGVGCENMLALCDRFLGKTGEDDIAYVLVGRNDAMVEKINSKYSSCGRIIPVSFTDKVNIYMNACNVMLSKSGGLSSTEAAVSNTPFVSVKSIPGCETKNAEFFSSRGMSVNASGNDEAIEYAVKLAHDDLLAERMRLSQRQTINPFAARDIVQTVISNGT